MAIKFVSRGALGPSHGLGASYGGWSHHVLRFAGPVARSLLAHFDHEVEERRACLSKPVRNTICDHNHIPLRQVHRASASQNLFGSKFARRFLLYLMLLRGGRI